MVCIYCSGPTQVVNSRKNVRVNATWRRRACRKCKAVFTTYEAVDYSNSFSVRHNGASLTPFSRDKLFVSIYESCRHRSNPLADATALTATILTKLLQQSTEGMITVDDIRHATVQTLRNFDHVAETYYTAYFAKKP